MPFCGFVNESAPLISSTLLGSYSLPSALHVIIIGITLLTASNGNPRLPDSLHYIDHNGRLNAYQQVRVT